MSEQELIDRCTAIGGPFYYSDLVRGLDTAQRRMLHVSFQSLRRSGAIEVGVPVPQREEVTPDYRFTDGERHRARYRLAVAGSVSR